MFIDIESILSYCDKIYSHEDPTDFFSNYLSYKYFNEVLKISCNEYSLSDMFLQLTHERLKNNDEEESDVLFLCHILWSCFDVYRNHMRPNTKTKLILLINIINSQDNDKTSLLRKLFYYHSVNEELRETCHLKITNNDFLYCFEKKEIKVIETIANIIKKCNTPIECNALNITIELFRLIISKSKEINTPILYPTPYNNNDMEIYIKNNLSRRLDIDILVLHNRKFFIHFLTHCLHKYKICSWDYKGDYNHISLFYGANTNKKIEFLNSDNINNNFTCEYFIESYILSASNDIDKIINTLNEIEDKNISKYIKAIILNSYLIDRNIKTKLKQKIM
ncbi:TPA: hypothetical protein RMM22_001445 [Escherichia fergusonii]|nr:hypothetical protein Ef18B006LT_25630 [Escherichia fergusonii]HDW3138020.1 hypothetical protein [Escherichia fergusonii]